MAGLSVSAAHGAIGQKMSDYTAGTSTPGAGDVEVRWNTTDANGKNVLMHEVAMTLRNIIRLLESGHYTINSLQAVNPIALSGGSAPPPLV